MTNTVELGRFMASRTKAAARFDPEVPWLLRQKVLLPDRTTGFVERPELARRCDPTQRRLTAFHAPGGFGKTTLLAEACRLLRERGVVVAWLTLNEDDDGNSLASYLSLAFSTGGLDIRDAAPAGDADDHGSYRMNLLLHSIDIHGETCVLALDDVDRMHDPAAMAIVDLLLKYGPPNLHLALTFRELPAGLDVATPILEGRGVTIAVDELRFGKPEVARFFDTSLSRRELDNLMDASDGWPIALCVHRNSKTTRSAPGDLASNWVETRLLRGITDNERDLILDASLFDWLNAGVVDQVLGVGSTRAIERMPALTGLLAKVDTAGMRLHPLVRQHCVQYRAATTPDRYRSIHRSIAEALAARGDVAAAMRHAAETGDPRLVGKILEDAGGIRVWQRGGPTYLRAADALLSEETVAQFPRLGLVRCIAQAMRGDLDPAKRTYARHAVETDGFTRDRPGGDDQKMVFDAISFQYIMALCGCQPIGTPEMNALTSRIAAFTAHRELGTLVQGLAKYGMGMVEVARTNLHQGLEWTAGARVQLMSISRYVTMYCDLNLGCIAMIQGRADDAAKAYARARRTAEAEFHQDVGPALITKVLAAELGLETNDVPMRSSRRLKAELPVLATSGAWLDVYAAEVGTVVELVRRDHGPEAALAELDAADDFAQKTERPTMARCILGLRLSLLVLAQRVDDAERLWVAEGLPRQAGELLDLGKQTWREVEALASAGLRLFTAQSDFETARELGSALLALAGERELVRLQMRGLALAMVLEQRAGDHAQARVHLLEYLRLFADTRYAGPLVSEREAGLAMLQGIDDTDLDERLENAAKRLTSALQGVPVDDGHQPLSRRELDIVSRLETMRDKEIGAVLHLSEDGVRYHVKNIFRKLGAANRFEAVRRARTLGILPGAVEERSPE